MRAVSSQKNTVFAASPGRGARRLAQSYPETEAPLGTFFGGVAREGTVAGPGLYNLPGNAEACYQGLCRRRVSGGVTLLVTPGSLAVHRVLPPSKAVAASNGLIAAAVLRLRSAYTGKARIVVEEFVAGHAPVDRPTRLGPRARARQRSRRGSARTGERLGRRSCACGTSRPEGLSGASTYPRSSASSPWPDRARCCVSEERSSRSTFETGADS